MTKEDGNILRLSSLTEIKIPEIPAWMKNLEERSLPFLIQADDFFASELALNSVYASKDLSNLLYQSKSAGDDQDSV